MVRLAEARGARERVERVLAWTEAAIVEGAGGDVAAERALRSVVLPATRAAREVPEWPPVALPLLVGDVLGLPADGAETVAAGCLLHFASADVIDDAQDGHLDPAHWPTWQGAVAGGLAAQFLAQQVVMASVPPGERAAAAAALGGAGLAMALGQRLDLAQHGPLGAVGGEEEYLACARSKTGASIALFASLPAIAAGASLPTIVGLRGWGEAMGCALQLSSDVMDTLEPASRDRGAGRITLVVQRAWARLGSADRPLLEAAWRGEPEAPPLDFLLQRTGALAYVRARIGALRIEAREALAAPGVAPGLSEALLGWTERTGCWDTARV
ncbi:MAG: polyprenyl synthetase family protein [Candidatus Sericytochromatia bacterium]|nr:polyprenyl synthetase family protein [Candidatus Sericytochromatia bacterium]